MEAIRGKSALRLAITYPWFLETNCSTLCILIFLIVYYLIHPFKWNVGCFYFCCTSVGSIRRGSGGAASLPTRVARLQQQAQQRVGSPSTVSNNNNNSGSPLTVGSPRTSSPTNSSASSGVTDPYMQNTCFRCRKPLVPPESVTLGPGTATPPIVTLTGALAVRLHETCFTCYMCRTKLNPQGYYHSLHRLLCPTCVRDGAVETCENCQRPIGTLFKTYESFFESRPVRVLGRNSKLF